jgi:hypothetical protein
MEQQPALENNLYRPFIFNVAAHTLTERPNLRDEKFDINIDNHTVIDCVRDRFYPINNQASRQASCIARGE